MKSVVAAFGIVLFIMGVGMAHQPAGMATRIEALLRQKFPPDQPGAAVLIRFQGKKVLEKGLGLADLKGKTPITPETNFDLASASKPMTALAVLRLVEEGKLKLDDDVAKLVPDLPKFAPIRLRQLLNHTSGLPSYLKKAPMQPAAFAKLTNADVPRFLRGQSLVFNPGEKMKYENTNYALLPLIVRKASGEEFGAYSRKVLFDPLGMKSTVIFDDMKVKPAKRALGYAEDGGRWVRAGLDGPICGDGNVFSNLRDLDRFIAAVEQRKIVKPETWKEVLTAPGVTDSDSGEPSNYGLGWIVRREGEKVGLGHSGAWAGTRSCLIIDGISGVSLAILCNRDGYDVDGLATEIFQALGN